ncbi:MAG: hypothetical protein N2485_06040 [bacterium]|nr:hypothetical protein [bacterium]
MFYFVFGNQYINFFNNDINFLIPVYYTISNNNLTNFGAYSFLQYILFNQYLRKSILLDSISLNNKVIKKIINNNVLDNEKIFFKIVNSIFTKDSLFSNLVNLDNHYKKDYQDYRIFYIDWELLYHNLKFSQEIVFIKRFDFDNFQTKIIFDIFSYFNKKVKIIDTWKYYFDLYKFKLNHNRAYLFIYFGYYNIELFVVSFGNLLYYLTNRYYNVSYKDLFSKLYSFLYQKGIFIKYFDLVDLVNYFLGNIFYIVSGKFDKEKIELISKYKDSFIKKELYYYEFKFILQDFYIALKKMFIDIFIKMDLQVIEDIYDGNFLIISSYKVDNLFLNLLNDIIIDVKI